MLLSNLVDKIKMEFGYALKQGDLLITTIQWRSLVQNEPLNFCATVP